jgi:hypothetical protein
MLIGTVVLGDTLATLTKTIPSDDSETYRMVFTDIPTGNTAIHEFMGFANAIAAFGGYITLDVGFDEIATSVRAMQKNPELAPFIVP